MIWKINCRTTRRLLALWAGNDLEERESRRAERHLAVCPPCREAWEQLKRSQRVLDRVRPAPADDARLDVSLWPAVARQVRVIDATSVAPNWRGWLPAGALAAACFAVLMVSLPDAPFGGGMAGNSAPVILAPSRLVSDPRESQETSSAPAHRSDVRDRQGLLLPDDAADPRSF